MRGIRSILIQRLDKITGYKNKVKRAKMDTSFLDISNNLVKSDFDQSILNLFQIDNLNNLTDHVAAFIGCDPFRAELSKLHEDLEKYKTFQNRSD